MQDEGANQGDCREGSTDDRYPTPICGGRAPENGGERGIWRSPACPPVRDRDLADRGMVQLAPVTPPSQWPLALKKVLLLGTNMEDAWAAALEVMTTHKGLQEIAAIVNVGHSGAVPAIVGLLKLTGWSRYDLALTGAHLSVTATSRSS